MDLSSRPPPRGRFLVHLSKRNPDPPPRGHFLPPPWTIRDPPKPPPLPPSPRLSPSNDQNTLDHHPIPLQPIDEKTTPSGVVQNTPDLPPPDPSPLQPIDEKVTPSVLPPPLPPVDHIPLQPIDEKTTPFDEQDTHDDLPPLPPTTDPLPLQPTNDENPTPSDDQTINDLLPKYDAFISFRGTDVRDNFLSHLFAHMNNEKRILTYKDDINLKRGDKIAPSLVEAIERSSSYVVIFSPNYATSDWCLDELVKILECTEKYGRKMVPVFYGGVTPSHVRNRKESYAKAFAEHEEAKKVSGDDGDNKEMEVKVERWKAALTDAANLSGFDSLVTKPEHQLVKEVTKRILEAIRPNSSPITEGLVGIEPEIEAVEKLLDTDDAKRNRIIGFWGMPGIGKTTLANAIYQKIDRDKFEGRHYIQKFVVQLKSKTVMELQNKLFDELLRDENSRDIEFCLKLSRLRRLRAFVIVDDVTMASIRALEELLEGKMCDLFGPGSRMILTSTDQQVLRNVCQEVHRVPGLDEEKALELFSFRAFKMDRPPRGEYRERCEKVVAYCAGNPLALRVLGVAFYEKRLELWDQTLEKLRTLHKKDIQDMLMISYDELSRDEQRAFLDLVCFFNHEDYEFVTRVVDEDLITNLVDKSLVGINNSKGHEVIEIHTLLEDLGKHIVGEERIHGKQSRFWEVEEVLELLARNKGTEATEGILLKLTEKDVKIETEYSDTFAKMWNLRFLCIELPSESKVVFPSGEGIINTLPDKLRYLHWDLFAATSLPSKFSPEKLRVLRLKHNSIHQLWEGANVVDLRHLKELNLTASKYLTEIPDLSTAKKLQLVDLTSCGKLIQLHNSIAYLPSLKTLILDSCKALNLSKLDKEGTQGSTVAFPSLERVNLDATPIEEVPRSLLQAPNLAEIECSGCPNFSKFPSIDDLAKTMSIKHLIFRNNKLLVDISKNIHMLKSLQTLDFHGCENLSSFPEISKTTMEGLLVLDLSYCSKISRIPNTVGNLVNLERLYLSGTGIKEIPSSILSLKSLIVLKFDECKKLVKIPDSFMELTQLETVAFSGCDVLSNDKLEFPDRVHVL